MQSYQRLNNDPFANIRKEKKFVEKRFSFIKKIYGEKVGSESEFRNSCWKVGNQGIP